MRVLLVGNYVPDDQISMQAFVRVLERELSRLGCELRVITPLNWMRRSSSSSRLGKWFGYIDKFVLFVPILAGHVRWADVVHICDHSNGMYVPWVRGKPNVITCHDVIAVQASLGMVRGWRVGRMGRLFQRLIARGLARADLVACVSHLTQRALLALGFVDEGRVTTVLNGLNDDFSPVLLEDAQPLIAKFNLSADDKYLIHVGSDLPRKNRKTVLEAFIALRQSAAANSTVAAVRQLVFVGPALEPEMADLVRQHDLSGHVKTIQKASHEELRALYSRATALLFPSLQEGFGWPLIEAQACGCPVFASDLAPMNEIGGEGVVYIDPYDPTAIAEAILAAVPQLSEMRKLGIENASHFSAAQMALNYLATYRRVLAKRGGQEALGAPAAASVLMKEDVLRQPSTRASK
jgi:glycosyltransferase involved in cell wall biosynthesis